MSGRLAQRLKSTHADQRMIIGEAAKLIADMAKVIRDLRTIHEADVESVQGDPDWVGWEVYARASKILTKAGDA